jgi:Protein of unknown function (DUF3995)
MKTWLTALAWLTASVFAGLSALHVYWAVGGRRGASVVVPERQDGRPTFRPRPVSTLVVAALLLLSAVLVLERAAVGPGLVPARLTVWGVWGLAAVVTLRAIGDFKYVGFFKRRRGTRFATHDTRYFSPLALALGLSAAVIAWAGG